MDIVDQANDAQDIVLDSLVQANRKKPPEFFNESQTCINCGDPVENTAQRFCCPECARDYEARKIAEIRNHGRSL